MKHALAIAHRDLIGAFDQPIAYVVLSAFLVLNGIYLFALQPFFILGRATVRPFFEFAPFILTLFAPALTMRTFAEERRSGVLDLTLSWPVAEWELVLGKFLGAWSVLFVALALTMVFPLTVSSLGPLDWGPVIGGYVGLVLLGGSYLALGIIISAITASQIVAFISGFMVCFSLYAVGRAATILPPKIAEIAEFIGLEGRFAHVARGILDTRDLTFFAMIIFVCIGLTAEWLATRRWRR